MKAKATVAYLIAAGRSNQRGVEGAELTVNLTAYLWGQRQKGGHSCDDSLKNRRPEMAIEVLCEQIA